MNKFKLEINERELIVLRTILIDSMDSAKYSKSVKKEFDDLRAKLAVAVSEVEEN